MDKTKKNIDKDVGISRTELPGMSRVHAIAATHLNLTLALRLLRAFLGDMPYPITLQRSCSCVHSTLLRARNFYFWPGPKIILRSTSTPY